MAKDPAVQTAPATQARPAQAPQPAALAPQAGPKIDTLTYIPGAEDPSRTVWRGMVFEANKPKQVPNKDHVEAARGNPWFSVNGAPPAERKAATGVPQNDVQYRGYAVKWITQAKSTHELNARWQSEDGLRTSCGVGTDDLEFLEPVLAVRREVLAKEEAEILRATGDQ